MRRINPNGSWGYECLESRILLSGPPEKFVVPVGGEEGKDWAVTAYVDVDPEPGSFQDYRGRRYTYDGSDAVHFALPDFATMDRGVDVYSAAGGMVVEVHDGEFDRQRQGAPPPPGTPDNYVLIDHGDGWRTRYGRLRNGSVVVTPGQRVAAGQRIGQVGGSGNLTLGDYGQSNAYLKFEVTHDGEHVETFLDPTAHWLSPPAFAGDFPGVHNIFTTSSEPPTAEAWEGLSRRRVFHPGETFWANTRYHGLNWERVRRHRVFRPDGTQFTDNENPGSDDIPQSGRRSSFLIRSDAPLGVWEVAFEVDGAELGRTSFIVAEPSEGLPEIKVYQGSTYVIDGRSTPIDFGTVNRGAAAPRRSFSIQNFGTQPLALDGVTLPEGFSIVGAAPTSVPADTFRTLTIQLDTGAAGAKAGPVVVRSNDAEEGVFNFAVKGTVTGPPAVVQVFVDGTNWGQSFRDFLRARGLGSERYGFDVTGGAGQPAALPWTNVDRVSVRFSSNVPVDEGDLSVTGAVAGLAYGVRPGGFSYDPATLTATWALDKPLANYPTARPAGDSVALELNVAGLEVSFRTPLSVVPGDANRNGNVGPTDFGVVRSGVGRNAGDVGAAPREYTVYKDVNGDGAVSPADLGVVRGNMAGAVASPVPLFAAAVPRVREEREGEELFGGTQIL